MLFIKNYAICHSHSSRPSNAAPATRAAAEDIIGRGLATLKLTDDIIRDKVALAKSFPALAAQINALLPGAREHRSAAMKQWKVAYDTYMKASNDADAAAALSELCKTSKEPLSALMADIRKLEGVVISDEARRDYLKSVAVLALVSLAIAAAILSFVIPRLVRSIPDFSWTARNVALLVLGAVALRMASDSGRLCVDAARTLSRGRARTDAGNALDSLIQYLPEAAEGMQAQARQGIPELGGDAPGTPLTAQLEGQTRVLATVGADAESQLDAVVQILDQAETQLPQMPQAQGGQTDNPGGSPEHRQPDEQVVLQQQLAREAQFRRERLKGNAGNE